MLNEFKSAAPAYYRFTGRTRMDCWDAQYFARAVVEYYEIPENQQKEDIQAAIQNTDIFDILVDII